MARANRGQIKAGKGPLIGDAGEYFVIGELLRRGIVAALAPRNTPGFDVIATSGPKSVNIRVKTKTSAAKGWVWNAKKDGSIFREVSANDFTVLVDLGDGTLPVEYFILQTQELEQMLKHGHEEWLRRPGLRGKPHRSNRMRRIGDHESERKWLKEYRNWSLIFNRLGVEEP